jgi:hypothetical protein
MVSASVGESKLSFDYCTHISIVGRAPARLTRIFCPAYLVLLLLILCAVDTKTQLTTEL